MGYTQFNMAIDISSTSWQGPPFGIWISDRKYCLLVTAWASIG